MAISNNTIPTPLIVVQKEKKTKVIRGRMDRKDTIRIVAWVTHNIDRIAQLTKLETTEAAQKELNLPNLNSATLRDIVRDMGYEGEGPWKRSPRSPNGDPKSRANISRFLARQLLFLIDEVLTLKRELSSPINPQNKIRIDILREYAYRNMSGDEADAVTQEGGK